MNKNPLSSSELGTLWITYLQKTLILRLLEHFLIHAEDQETKNIMGGCWQEVNHYVEMMQGIFLEENVAIPIGFTKNDVNLESPNLYNNGFDIMFLRVLKEISLGMYTINIGMSYREDVMNIYQNLSQISIKIYRLCTHYLVKKGILTLPPTVKMPKTAEFVKNTSYMNGLNPFKQDRPLNDIEMSVLHHGIESNNIGMQLLTGFAQVAETKEVKDYFVRGIKLAKKQIKEFEEILLENDISFSGTSGGTIAASTVAPFSEKLMACNFFLNSFGLVGTSFGTMFTVRNDISLKQALIAREIYTYGNDGIKIMIRNGWFEEPPQTENRSQLINK